MRLCPACLIEKSLSEYHKSSKNRNGACYYCKVCQRAKSIANNAANPGRKRANNMLRSYGINQAQYDWLLASQGGVCKICYGPQKGKKNMAVDHDHKTLEVRGLLCTSCNTMLGQAQDRVWVLRNGIDYLEQSVARWA
jgi:hypothetical protein